MTVTENAALFKKCLISVLNEESDAIVARKAAGGAFSGAHARRMSAILGFKVRNYSIAKRALIIIIAAAFLLTGCTAAIVYRAKGRQMHISDFYGSSVSVWFSDTDLRDLGAGDIAIGDRYEFSYMPENISGGYYVYGSRISMYVYTLDHKSPFVIRQMTLDSSVVFDLERGNARTLEFDGQKVFVYDRTDGCQFVWNDGKYMFWALAMDVIPDGEIVKIVSGVVPPSDE